MIEPFELKKVPVGEGDYEVMHDQHDRSQVLVIQEKPAPEPNIIDLSKVVGSNILMQFTATSKPWALGSLVHIKNGLSVYPYRMHTQDWYQKCRFSERWQVHHYRGNPLPEGVRREVRYASGKTWSGMIDDADWLKHPGDKCLSHIVAFRVFGLHDNWFYEWQKKDD